MCVDGQRGHMRERGVCEGEEAWLGGARGEGEGGRWDRPPRGECLEGVWIWLAQNEEGAARFGCLKGSVCTMCLGPSVVVYVGKVSEVAQSGVADLR